MNFIKKVVALSFIVIALSHCSPDQELSQSKVERIALLPGLSDRKAAYQLLNPTEKTAIWSQHLSASLSVLETTEGRGVVSEGLRFAKTDFFSSKLSTDQVNEFEVWKYQASKLFNSYQLALLFGDVHAFTKEDFKRNTFFGDTKTSVSGRTEYILPPCECKKSQDFCSQYDYPSGGVYYKCQLVCGSRTNGCGWFWASDCDAACKQFIFL